eukprot:6301455-Prymnesium_polylepis.1
MERRSAAERRRSGHSRRACDKKSGKSCPEVWRYSGRPQAHRAAAVPGGLVEGDRVLMNGTPPPSEPKTDQGAVRARTATLSQNHRPS